MAVKPSMSSIVITFNMYWFLFFMFFHPSSGSFLVKNSTISPNSLSGVTLNFGLSFRDRFQSESNRSRRMGSPIDSKSTDYWKQGHGSSDSNGLLYSESEASPYDSTLDSSIGFSSPARCTLTFNLEPETRFATILNGAPSYPYFSEYHDEINQCVFDYFTAISAGTFYSEPLDRKCNYYNSPNSECNSPFSYGSLFRSKSKQEILSYCDLNFTNRKLPIVNDCFVTVDKGHDLTVSTSSFSSKVSASHTGASLLSERFLMVELPSPFITDGGFSFNGLLFRPQKFYPFDVLLSQNSSVIPRRKRDGCVVLCFGHGGSGASTSEVNAAISHMNSALSGFANQVNSRFDDVSKMSMASTKARSLNSQAISQIVNAIKSLHNEVTNISLNTNESFGVINSDFATNQKNLDSLYEEITSVSSYMTNSTLKLDNLYVSEELRTFVLSSFSSDKQVLESNFPYVFNNLSNCVESLGFSSWNFLRSGREIDGSVTISLSLLDIDPFTSTEIIGQIPFGFNNDSIQNSCFGSGSVLSKDGSFYYSPCATCPKYECSITMKDEDYYLIDCPLECHPPYPTIKNVYHFSSSGSFVEFNTKEDHISVVDSDGINFDYSSSPGFLSFDTDVFSSPSVVKVINYTFPNSNFSTIVKGIAPLELKVADLNNYVSGLADKISENINVSTVAPIPNDDSSGSSCKESFIGICFDGLEHIFLFILFMLFLFVLLVALYHYFAHKRKTKLFSGLGSSKDDYDESDARSINIANGTTSV